MFIVGLQCHREHRFEGWYDSQQDYFAQSNDDKINCPLCDSDEVTRLSPHARIRPSFLEDITVPSSAPQRVPPFISDTVSLDAQKAISRILKKIRETYRDMPIADTEEEKCLDTEGLPYFKILVSDIEKN